MLYGHNDVTIGIKTKFWFPEMHILLRQIIIVGHAYKMCIKIH